MRACIKNILGAESYSCTLLSTRNDSLTGSKHSLLTLRHQGKRTGRGCEVLTAPFGLISSAQGVLGRRGSVPENLMPKGFNEFGHCREPLRE